ncbi:MAG: LysM peptidoglycan-binding domain-containing protein [bacterium]
MIKKTNFLGLLVLFLSFLALLSTGCSHGTGYSSKRINSSYNYAGAGELTLSPEKEWRPSSKNSIPMTQNARVKKWVATFNGNLRPSFAKWIKRIGYYGPTVSAILKEEGVPQDLIYLAMIESGFNTTARSHANAVGPWQFISSTGRLYGLNNGFFVDDRRDLISSTRAAAKHLKDLYKVYGDWYLSFAAYNAGPGKVNRAIQRSGSKNYWTISSSRSRHLRQETKDYVPKILAAMHIVKNYKKYGYSDSSFGKPIQFAQVSVPDATDIKALARSAKTSPKEIAHMNPSLVLGITPPGKSTVYVPKDAADEFKKNYAMIPVSKRVTSLQYKTGQKETIATVAKKYNLDAKKIAQINKISSTHKRLKAGTIIKIPANKDTLNTIAKLSQNNHSQSKTSSRKKTKYYKVRPGDTLSRIAKSNKTTVTNLANWNRLKTNKPLKIGQKIKIYQKSYSTQTTSSGGFLASNYTLPKGQKRLSGVNHIIIQDATTGEAFKPTKTKHDDYIDMPTLVATRSAAFDTNANQPAVIKSFDGRVISTIEEEIEEPKKQQKTKYHTIKPGENLYTIASKYQLRVSELKAINSLESDIIRANQKLVVSKNTSNKIAKAPAPSSRKTNTVYTIQPGDSLSTIAVNHGVTVTNIKDWNGLPSTAIRAGQKLKILSGIKVARNTKTKSNSQKVIYHKVEQGDTLWSLSKRYQVKISDIMKWNEMKSDTVKPQQKLKIIAMKAGKSNKATL